MSRQLRRHSAIEVCLNTGSGFVLALVTNWALHYWLAIPLTDGQNITITIAFTVVSLLRSYFWRRVFNWWQHRSTL